MRRHRRITTASVAGLVGIVAIAVFAALALANAADHRAVNGTIWVANRGADTIRGFDAATGEVVSTIAMAPG